MALRPRRWLFVLAASIGLVAASAVVVPLLPPFGGTLQGARLARAKRSAHFADGSFRNLEPSHKLQPGTFWEMTRHWLFGAEQREPEAPISIVPRSTEDYATPPSSGLRATWIGHASVLIEIDGQRVLVDPIFSERSSPFGFVGPRRFFPPPIALSELPRIAAAVISHDHYDHLDMATVTALAARGTQLIVPLGVGAHLERWDVPAARITELDWYENTSLNGLRFTATPARHYSGRGLWNGDEILWASWSIAGARHRVFFSGDTGYSAEFVKIGERLGPFDLTLIKIGASDPTWHEIHMSPEDAVKVHRDVRGRLLLPVHWATFNLANHAWNEPADRLVAAARTAGIAFVVPRPGAWVEPSVSEPTARWW